MAAVTASNPLSHNRIRSASDPFVDPSYLPRSHNRPPAPPPKHLPRMPAPVPKAPSPHRDITEAVRDTVTVRHVDPSPRTKMRSQTVIAPTPNSRPPPTAGRRSHSQDSVTAAAAAVEKAKNGGKHRPKKGSQHADVIDRLDFTGVAMFHHDGPFDACAPSRNRHRTKAPMLAWSSRPVDPASGQPASDDTDPYEPPKKKVDAIAEAWGIHEPEPFEEFFAGGGNSRLDGDTPTSSIYAGKEGHNSSRTGANGKRKEPREIYRDHLEDGQPQVVRRSADRRSVLPPPQPIFTPDSQSDIEVSLGSPTAGSNRPDGPKRSRSIMQRIRKMRDSPNVPVSSDDNADPSSPTSTESFTVTGSQSNSTARPTHRSQHSFLGRFAGGRSRESANPTSEQPEAFVYIEDSRNQYKDLPAPPRASGDSSQEVETSYNTATGPQSPGLGRKGSLMRRVRGVVKGTK